MKSFSAATSVNATEEFLFFFFFFQVSFKILITEMFIFEFNV